VADVADADLNGADLGEWVLVRAYGQGWNCFADDEGVGRDDDSGGLGADRYPEEEKWASGYDGKRGRAINAPLFEFLIARGRLCPLHFWGREFA
jgi:hypothetical protein